MNVTEVKTKVISEENEYVSFAIKALVENNSKDTEVMVELQGLDNEGFEIFSIFLKGSIEVGESKILTLKEDYVKKDIFDQIVQWQTR
ncbi:MAG: hypothetical protein K8R35_06935 [Bacteroidales bacterium]|nr:hypothetical protein [Bacteroidales bacterium]